MSGGAKRSREPRVARVRRQEDSGRAKRSPEEPGRVRRSQEESGKVRRSQEEPRGVRRSQEESGGARARWRSQEEPGGVEGARRSRDESGAVRRNRGRPGGVKRSRRLTLFIAITRCSPMSHRPQVSCGCMFATSQCGSVEASWNLLESVQCRISLAHTGRALQ